MWILLCSSLKQGETFSKVGDLDPLHSQPSQDFRRLPEIRFATTQSETHRRPETDYDDRLQFHKVCLEKSGVAALTRRRGWRRGRANQKYSFRANCRIRAFCADRICPNVVASRRMSGGLKFA